MKTRNKATQKTHKFNIVDIVVLVLALVILVAAFLWIDPFGWITPEKEDKGVSVLFILELNDVEKSVGEKIKLEDEVVFYDTIGKVVQMSKAPALIWSIPANGDQMVLYRHPNKDTIFVTLEIECIYKEGEGYFINDKQILVGQSMNFRFPTFEATGECVSIQIKD